MNPKEIIMRAIQCEQAGRDLEAQSLYHEGIQILMEKVGQLTDLQMKKVYYERIKEYLCHAEQIKDRVQKYAMPGELVTNIPIGDDSIGHSYQTLFSKYLTPEVKEVLIEEPYLVEKYQVRTRFYTKYKKTDLFD